MAGDYGRLLCDARKNHDPPLSAKDLASAINVTPPFITDIEKGRRLPSLENQKEIKRLFANREQLAEIFDDTAASDHDDPRIVAEDLAKAIRKDPALRKLIREIISHKLSAKQIQSLVDSIGGNTNATK